MEAGTQETIAALCHRAQWESWGLGCSNYHVPSGRDVKRLSVSDLHAPGDAAEPEPACTLCSSGSLSCSICLKSAAQINLTGHKTLGIKLILVVDLIVT